MARRGQHSNSRPQRRSRKPHERLFKSKLALALCLLAEAEDELEETTALLIAMLALRERREARAPHPFYGHRGAYNVKKTLALFDLIMNIAPERWFMSWFR